MLIVKNHRNLLGVFLFGFPFLFTRGTVLGKEVGLTPAFSPCPPRLHAAGLLLWLVKEAPSVSVSPARWWGTRWVVRTLGREGSLSHVCIASGYASPGSWWALKIFPEEVNSFS